MTTHRPTRRPPSRTGPRALERWLPEGWVRLAVELLEDRLQPSTTLQPVTYEPGFPALGPVASIVSSVAPASPPVSFTSTDLPAFTDRLSRLDVDSRGSQPAPLARPAAPRHELVLVEFDVPDRDVLLRGLLALPGGGTALEVVELHGGGVAEITSVLRRHAGLDAVHIVSHGAAGALDLGSEWLEAGNLGEHAGELQAWGAALKPGGDLLLYGCAVAATDAGRGFVTQVSRLSGADVAASTDLTGTAALGGNWRLEYTAGPIQAASLAPAGWSHTLAAAAPVVTVTPPTGQLVVDTTSDAVNGDTSSIAALLANKGADGRVSLREAILATNNTPNGGGPDQITFNISGSGPHTISPGSALPTITDAVVIDGTTQSGGPGVKPDIVLNGTSAGAATDGLTLAAGAAGSTVRGLVIKQFGHDGIRISGGGGNRIAGNYIGTNPTGTVAAGNGYVGIEVVNSANNVIGGTTAADRNIVSGNASDGVDLVGAGSTGNVIEGNYVGTDVTGTVKVGNGANGIWLGSGASANTVGGTATGAGNLVAGNIDDGIEIEGSTSAGNAILGNWVGLTAAGTAALGNDGGVIVQDAPNTTIGGTGAGAGNVISGNVRSGILVFGLNATGTQILGNLIGTDPGGTQNLGNGLAGIGTSDSGDGITGIGSPTNTTIGGTTPGAGNTIAFNLSWGVVVEKGTGTAIRGNSITSNADLGIDLGRDGVTPNDTLDADTGPNQLQNFPVLSAVSTSGGSLTANGNLKSRRSTTFNLDFYASPTADPSGYGEGALYIGTATVTTDSSGNGPFSVSVTGPAVPAGWVVTATATDPAGNTSEFGPAVQTNRQPTPGNDSYTTAEDTPLTIANPGVLANDTDPDGDPLTVTGFNQPTHGTLTLGANGGFTYTPATNYNGPDAFTYVVNDGRGGTATGTVSLTVTPVNDTPIAVNDSYSTAVNTPLVSTPLFVSSPGVLVNDTDPDGDPLTAQLVSGPANGLLTLNPNGSFTYIAVLNFSGTDSFTYRASDGTASTVATVFINVASANQPPTATADGYSTTEDTPLVVAGPGVLANDTDPNGDTLTPVLDTGPTHGTLTLGANGGFTYTPTADYNGPDTFTYHVTDGSLNSAPVTVTLTITPVNDPPTLNPPGDRTVPEDAASQTVTLTGITAGGGEAQTVTITASSSNPAIIPNPVIGYTSPGAAGTLTFTPVPNAHGTVVITVTVSDGVATVTQTFTVTVTPVNDPPTAAGESYATLRDTPVIVPAAGILTNDTDPDGDPLSAVLVAGPTNGTVVLNVNGSFTYTPGPGFAGSDSFTYAATDGTASSTAVVTIAVLAPVANGPPQGAADNYSTSVGTTLTVAGSGVLANDTDPEGDPLTAVLVTGGGHGTVTLAADGSFSYTPDPGFTGTDQFTYQVSDGQQLSGVVTVTIQVIGSASPQTPVPDPTTPPPNPGTPTSPTPTPTSTDNPPPNSGTPTGPAPTPSPAAPPPRGAPTGGTPTTTAPTVVLTNEPIAGTTTTSGGAAHVPNADVPTVTVPARDDLNRFFVLPVSVAAVPEPVAPVAPPGPTADTRPTPAAPPSTGGVVVTPTPAPVAGPVVAPVAEIPPVVEVPPDAALAGLDQAATDIREETRDQAVTDTLVVTGGVAVAGYVLLNTRAVFWFLSALLARPAVWRRFDPLDVIFAWEQDRDAGPARHPDPEADESLQSMVE